MNNLSPELIAQIYAQESDDPFLTLVTLDHESFAAPVRLVNNSVNIISRGQEFTAFPMRIVFPADDGETARLFKIEFDNVSLDLVEHIRSTTTLIGVKIEMILASIPDAVQMSQSELKIQNIVYTSSKISATIILDNFLNTEVTSERYGPQNFPGLF